MVVSFQETIWTEKLITTHRQGYAVYVTDTDNHCIQRFTPEGKFLFQFGTYGSDPGQLINQSGIVIDDNNLVYVTESYSIYGELHQFLIIVSLSLQLMVTSYVSLDMKAVLWIVLMVHLE